MILKEIFIILSDSVDFYFTTLKSDLSQMLHQENLKLKTHVISSLTQKVFFQRLLSVPVELRTDGKGVCVYPRGAVQMTSTASLFFQLAFFPIVINLAKFTFSRKERQNQIGKKKFRIKYGMSTSCCTYIRHWTR